MKRALVLTALLAGCGYIEAHDPPVPVHTHPCLAGAAVPACPDDYSCPGPFVAGGKCEYDPTVGPGDPNANSTGVFGGKHPADAGSDAAR